jgi:hypothetical protein
MTRGYSTYYWVVNEEEEDPMEGKNKDQKGAFPLIDLHECMLDASSNKVLSSTSNGEKTHDETYSILVR